MQARDGTESQQGQSTLHLSGIQPQHERLALHQQAWHRERHHRRLAATAHCQAQALGLWFMFQYLCNIKGYGWNHKSVYRIYRQLELNLRIKPKRRIKRDKPDALQVPQHVNQVWSMGFTSDSLADGRALRTFNAVDDYNREGLGLRLLYRCPAPA